jgi:hypothetical protein
MMRAIFIQYILASRNGVFCTEMLTRMISFEGFQYRSSPATSTPVIPAPATTIFFAFATRTWKSCKAAFVVSVSPSPLNGVGSVVRVPVARMR